MGPHVYYVPAAIINPVRGLLSNAHITVHFFLICDNGLLSAISFEIIERYTFLCTYGTPCGILLVLSSHAFNRKKGVFVDLLQRVT